MGVIKAEVEEEEDHSIEDAVDIVTIASTARRTTT